MTMFSIHAAAERDVICNFEKASDPIKFPFKPARLLGFYSS
jgi:hypothetical protein